MGVSAIALQGLQQAQLQLENSATRVAGTGLTTPSSAGPSMDTVDLSTEMVAQLSAKNQFAANLVMLKTDDERQKTTLNLLA